MVITDIFSQKPPQQDKIQLSPLFLDMISAGFPSPAREYVEKPLDLNEYCNTNPAATYYIRVQGDSMKDAGIHYGDIVIVDRSLTPKDGAYIVAHLFGEMTLKCLELKPTPRLVPKNQDYPAIDITDEADFQVFGVVTGVVRKYGGY